MSLELVKKLMDELQEAMSMSGDDVDERLGREPEVEVSVEGDVPMDDEMDFDDQEGMFGPKEGVDLKKRLMSIRGK